MSIRLGSCLSNHFIRPRQHIGRNCHADLLRRFQIDQSHGHVFSRRLGKRWASWDLALALEGIEAALLDRAPHPLALFHLITLSARASTFGGILRPDLLCDLKIIRGTFFGCCASAIATAPTKNIVNSQRLFLFMGTPLLTQRICHKPTLMKITFFTENSASDVNQFNYRQ